MQVYPNISESSKWMFISFNWFLENNHPFGTEWIAGNKIPVRQSLEQVFLCLLLFSTLSGLTSTIHTSRCCWLRFLQSCIWLASSFKLISESIGCLHSQLFKNRFLCVCVLSQYLHLWEEVSDTPVWLLQWKLCRKETGGNKNSLLDARGVVLVPYLPLQHGYYIVFGKQFCRMPWWEPGTWQPGEKLNCIWVAPHATVA